MCGRVLTAQEMDVNMWGFDIGLKVVMFGPGSAQKPRLGLGFWGLGLTESSSQAMSPQRPEPSPGLGLEPGLSVRKSDTSANERSLDCEIALHVMEEGQGFIDEILKLAQEGSEDGVLDATLQQILAAGGSDPEAVSWVLVQTTEHSSSVGHFQTQQVIANGEQLGLSRDSFASHDNNWQSRIDLHGYLRELVEHRVHWVAHLLKAESVFRERHQLACYPD